MIPNLKDSGGETLYNIDYNFDQYGILIQSILKKENLKGANIDKGFVKYLSDDVLPQLKSKKIDYKTLENINFGLKDFYKSAYKGTVGQSGAKTATEKLSQSLIQSIEKGILTLFLLLEAVIV